MAAVTPDLGAARRIVVKIGSSTLVDPVTGTVRQSWFDGFTQDIKDWHDAGKKIVLVSSGAIALGRRPLKYKEARRLKLEEKQAAAAVGQIGLARTWSEGLSKFGIVVGQILLTYKDAEDQRRYLNARQTLEILLSDKAIPVINENDTIATDEIRYGDNDRLAAHVAALTSADVLVLLSDIDGLYTANPRKDKNATLIPLVRDITPDIEAMAEGAGSMMGSGGMATKVMAARLATEAGCHMVIARGDVDRPLKRLVEGAPCTWFEASATPQAVRKRRISGVLKPLGTLTIDDGAAEALRSGKSLLPAGVRGVSEDFSRGDCLRVTTMDGVEIGRGLSAYDAKDARAIMGRKSSEIETVLGMAGRDEIIHRDDFVLKGR